jgi:hypothetical protein
MIFKKKEFWTRNVQNSENGESNTIGREKKKADEISLVASFWIYFNFGNWYDWIPLFGRY